MIKHFKVVNLLLSCALLSGCATTSNRTKTLLAMAGAGLAGGGVGYITTPEGTANEPHAALYGGLAAATAGLIGLFIFDEEKRASHLKNQNEIIKRELDACRGNSGESLANVISSSGELHFNKEVPPALRALVAKGRWESRKFKDPLEGWVFKSNTYAVRECEDFTIIPQSLQSPREDHTENPSTLDIREKEKTKEVMPVTKENENETDELQNDVPEK